jgi:hypothetical protein
MFCSTKPCNGLYLVVINLRNALLGLVHTFQFLTGRQVQIITGQSSGMQESVGVFTQPGCLAGQLLGSTQDYPLLRPVAGQ